MRLFLVVMAVESAVATMVSQFGGTPTTLVSILSGLLLAVPVLSGLAIWFGRDHLALRRQYIEDRTKDTRDRTEDRTKIEHLINAAAQRVEQFTEVRHLANVARFESLDKRVDPMFYLIVGHGPTGAGGYLEQTRHTSDVKHSHADHLTALSDWARRMGEAQGVPYDPPRAEIRPHRRASDATSLGG